jgi:hypothetical protein
MEIRLVVFAQVSHRSPIASSFDEAVEATRHQIDAIRSAGHAAEVHQCMPPSRMLHFNTIPKTLTIELTQKSAIPIEAAQNSFISF